MGSDKAVRRDAAGSPTAQSFPARPDAEGRGAFGSIGQWQGVAVLAAVLLVAVLVLQGLSGARGANFASDASGHYVSSLLIHDYLLAWPLQHPLKYLANYHAHYPVVGLGTWPPLYYTITAGWMFLSSTSQSSVIVLSALATTATALLLAAQATRRVPGVGLRLVWGLAAGLAFVCMPVVQEASGTLMLDVPVTLMCLAAVLAYADFLDTGRWRSALLFGLFASAGLLFKGSAGALALVPPLALLLGRRLHWVLRPAFWSSAVVVLLLAGPWYLATFHRSEAGFSLELGWDYWSRALRFDLRAVYEGVGPLLFGLAVVRILRLCLPSGHRSRSVDVAAAALALSVIPFHLAVPVDLQARYMLPMMAAVILLAFNEAAELVGQLAARWQGSDRGRRVGLPWAIGVLVMALPALVGVMHIPPANHGGMLEAVQQAMRALPAGNPVILAATDPEGEAEAISGVARLDENRPRVFVVRGSRIFGDPVGAGYLNTDYRQRFASPEELLREIERYGIPVMVFRRSRRAGPDWGHLEQIEALLRSQPERWEEIGRTGEGVLTTTIYRIRGHEGRLADQAALRRLSGPRGLQAHLDP